MGWGSGGAKVLGKLPVRGVLLIWMAVGQGRAYSTCSRCGCGLFGHFFSHLSLLFSFSLSLSLSGRRPDIHGRRKEGARERGGGGGGGQPASQII